MPMGTAIKVIIKTTAKKELSEFAFFYNSQNFYETF